MIWSIGEILADMVLDGEDCRVNAGGAPFNAAVAARDAGAEVLFLGRVGCDLLGDGLASVADRYLPESAILQRDHARGTTVAVVSLSEGERSFAFCRQNTADYHLDVAEIPFDRLSRGDMVNLGTLAFSEPEGVENMRRIVAEVKARGGILCMDVNFRQSLFEGKVDMVSAFRPFAEVCDVIKFSDDELKIFVDVDDSEVAMSIAAERYPSKTIVVTLGEAGSACICRGHMIRVGASKVTPLDTTGAGDAFWGTFLANIQSKEWSDEALREALRLANIAGGEAVKHFGALRPIKPYSIQR